MKHVPDDWHCRGYHPHLNERQITQFVTFRLWDSLAKEDLTKLELELERMPPNRRGTWRARKIQGWLDAGAGSCTLRDPRAAGIVANAIKFGDQVDYIVEAYVIMPNHVHLLITLIGRLALSEIIQRLKSFTSHQINRTLSRSGNFWRPDYYDRYVRNPAHFASVVEYIKMNPVDAGLCNHPHDWPWTWVRS